jgi:hypothetical protein
MAGLERLLKGPLDQVGMIRTTDAQAAQVLGIEAAETIWIARDEAPSVSERMAAGVAGQDSPVELGVLEEQRRDFDEVLARMLWSEIARMASSGEMPRVAGEYSRWLEESRRILARHGYALNVRNEEQQQWGEWERNRIRWEAQGMRAHVKLVETTLRSLGPILRGEKRATDVMFPSSSLALVEGIYKNDAVADHFNRVMSDVVRWYVEPETAPAGIGSGHGWEQSGDPEDVGCLPPRGGGVSLYRCLEGVRAAWRKDIRRRS